MCLDGKFEIQYNETETVQIEKGETVLIPAVLEHFVLNPIEQSKLLEIYIPEPEKEKKTD